MKKLKLMVEELAVETFELDASLLGREGTVAARAESVNSECQRCVTYTICEVVDNTCFQPSRDPNDAACAPPPAEG